MTKPLISVIIPIYNAENYLKHAVNSVITQTYTNLEIILVNDNSTDNSLELCQSFSDPRIKIISNTSSLGAAGARNKGLDIFAGEYVAFVDSDDYIHPRYIELLYDSIVDNDADISCCEFMRTYINDIDSIHPAADIKNTIVMSGIDAALNIVDRKSMFYVVFWNKLFKRYIWDDLRLPTGKRAEDFYISYIFLSKAKKISIIDACLYYYYQQLESVVHTNDDFSIYMEEALDGFDSFLTNISDSKKQQKYSDLSQIFRCDMVLEDYWKAYKQKDKKRMEETYKRALELKTVMLNRRIPLRKKFRLFYANRFLYKIGRKLFDVKEKVAILLLHDNEGRIV